MSMAEMKKIIKSILRSSCAALSPLWSKKSVMTLDSARRMLEDTAAKPEGVCTSSNKLAEIACDLQIIIPAYNVETYLESCMESVLNQNTKYSYHVVLVDDGAKDSTPEICDRYAEHPLVTVIHQKNRGLSGARNTGLKTLFGRYVLFVDSDDMLPQGAIEGLLDTAYRYDADCVEGGAYYLIDGTKTIMHRYEADGVVENPYRQIHGHAWGKLYKRELFASRCFPEGYWYEDSLISMLLFSEAKKICVSSQMAYAYRINQEGIVKSSVGKPRAVETYYITEQLLQERRETGLPMDQAFFDFMLLQIRLNQLRISNLDERIQEAVFVLTCSLMETYFDRNGMQGKEKHLIRALKTRDFGMFQMCSKFF